MCLSNHHETQSGLLVQYFEGLRVSTVRYHRHASEVHSRSMQDDEPRRSRRDGILLATKRASQLGSSTQTGWKSSPMGSQLRADPQHVQFLLLFCSAGRLECTLMSDRSQVRLVKHVGHCDLSSEHFVEYITLGQNRCDMAVCLSDRTTRLDQVQYIL